MPVSLLDSLDSTLENEKRATPAVQRTSGDMQTIPELTGEISTTTITRRHSGLEHIDRDGCTATKDAGRRLSNTEAMFTLLGNRRLSNTQAGFTLSANNDGTGSGNVSAKDVAGKTLSGKLWNWSCEFQSATSVVLVVFCSFFSVLWCDKGQRIYNLSLIHI